MMKALRILSLLGILQIERTIGCSECHAQAGTSTDAADPIFQPSLLHDCDMMKALCVQSMPLPSWPM